MADDRRCRTHDAGGKPRGRGGLLAGAAVPERVPCPWRPFSDRRPDPWSRSAVPLRRVGPSPTVGGPRSSRRVGGGYRSPWGCHVFASRRSGRTHPGLIIALVVATVVAATTPAAPVAADHEEPAGVASRSWARCSPSSAAPATGTRRARRRRWRASGDGTWSFTADVPAGSCEWKVALDGRWDRSYPAGQRPARAGRPTRADVLLRRRHPPRRRRPPPTRPTGVTAADRAARRHVAARRPDPRAVLLRDGRPLRQRRPDQRHRRPHRRPRWPTGFDPTAQGLLPRRRPRRPARPARLHRGPRHHRDLADAVVQEPAGAGRGRRTPAPATTATGSPTSPRSTRTSAPTPSSSS